MIRFAFFYVYFSVKTQLYYFCGIYNYKINLLRIYMANYDDVLKKDVLIDIFATFEQTIIKC